MNNNKNSLFKNLLVICYKFIVMYFFKVMLLRLNVSYIHKEGEYNNSDQS